MVEQCGWYGNNHSNPVPRLVVTMISSIIGVDSGYQLVAVLTLRTILMVLKTLGSYQPEVSYIE